MKTYTKHLAFFAAILLVFSLCSCSAWGEWATMDDWNEEFGSSSEDDSTSGDSSSPDSSSSDSEREGTEYGYTYSGTKTDETSFAVISCGGLLSGNSSYYSDDGFTVELGKDDVYSDFVDAGIHSVAEACKDAVGHSFDSLAVVSGYKVTVFSDKDGKGTVLLDVTGPAIVYNIKWKDHGTFTFINDLIDQNWSGRDSQSGEYWRELFPSSVRTWSSSDMNDWKSGSIKVEQL